VIRLREPEIEVVERGGERHSASHARVRRAAPAHIP